MATLRTLSRKAINVAPTVSTLPSGVPYAAGLNLAAAAPAHHGHDHGHVGPRADAQPSWAGGFRSSRGSLISKTYINGQSAFFAQRTIDPQRFR